MAGVFQTTVQDRFGNIIRFPTVEVRDIDGNLVNLFASLSGSPLTLTGALSNPFTGDGNGFIQFFTDTSPVNITVSKNGASTTYSYVAIGPGGGEGFSGGSSSTTTIINTIVEALYEAESVNAVHNTTHTLTDGGSRRVFITIPAAAGSPTGDEKFTIKLPPSPDDASEWTFCFGTPGETYTVGMDIYFECNSGQVFAFSDGPTLLLGPSGSATIASLFAGGSRGTALQYRASDQSWWRIF